MATPTQTKAETKFAPVPEAPKNEPETASSAPADTDMFIIDLTAGPDRISADGQVTIPGHRDHEIVINGQTRAFRFKHNEPVKMPFEAGLKFLKNEGFKRTDADGRIQDWQNAPKQPDELQPGEVFKLATDEVVARYSELRLEALQLRAGVLQGGEIYAQSKDRAKIAAFLTERAELRRKNTVPDMGADQFTPPAEMFDDDDFS